MRVIDVQSIKNAYILIASVALIAIPFGIRAESTTTSNQEVVILAKDKTVDH